MSAVLQEIAPAKQPSRELQRIIGQKPPKAYPLDALPDLLREAVAEVQAYVQAPDALIAGNALAASSLAVQGLAKVRRDRQLVSPLALYLLIISDPNERKTFGESFFTRSIKQWQREQIARLKPDFDKYLANHEGWKAQQRGITQNIQKLARDGDNDDLEKRREELRAVIEAQPEPPLTPKLVYTDATHQALIDGLMKYPSAGILTSEGGAFFGGAGFQSDAIMAALSVYNGVWSDDEITIDRKGEGSAVVRYIALMMNIAVQPDVLERFLTRTGSLARGSGFLARVLLSVPETTQGTRLYKEPPEDFAALAQFNDRITELLNLQREYIGDDRRLKRRLLDLSPEAKQVWVKYYESTESEQGAGGAFEFIRGEAGKSADNAARIAAIFHVLECGLDGEISADHMKRGCKVAYWHLSESLRFMHETDMPEQFKNAQEVSQRIAAYCHKNQVVTLTRREVLQYCKTSKVKDLKTLNPVIDELLDADHLLERKNEGRSQILVVNPRICDLWQVQ